MAENAQPVLKRLRLTSKGAVDTPPDTVVDAFEFDLMREDSSDDEMCPDAEENAQPVLKRLRLTSKGAVDTPPDTVVDAFEFDLMREDSSDDERCPDAEVGAIVVDSVAPTFVECQPVRSTTIDSDGPTPHQSTIPIGIIGDTVPNIHTSDTERRPFRL